MVGALAAEARELTRSWMRSTVIDLPTPRCIRTRAEHRTALRELDRLMKKQPKRRSAEGDRLELLAVLIQDYEHQLLSRRKTRILRHRGATGRQR